MYIYKNNKYSKINNIALNMDGTVSVPLDDTSIITIPATISEGGVTTEEILDYLEENEGSIFEDSEYELKKAQEYAFSRVKEKRIILEISGVATPYGIVDSDVDSQRKINGAVTMALITLIVPNAPPFQVFWRMQNNSIIELDATGMITMGQVVGQTVAKYQMVKNHFDNLISSALSKEEVELIDIDQDWMLVDLTPAPEPTV